MASIELHLSSTWDYPVIPVQSLLEQEIVGNSNDGSAFETFASISRRLNQMSTRKNYGDKKTFTLGMHYSRRSLPVGFSPVVISEELECHHEIIGPSVLLDPGGDNIFHWFNEIFLPLFSFAFDHSNYLSSVHLNVVLMTKKGWERSETFNISSREVVLQQLRRDSMKSILLSTLISFLCKRSLQCKVVLSDIPSHESLCIQRFVLVGFTETCSREVSCFAQNTPKLFEAIYSSVHGEIQGRYGRYSTPRTTNKCLIVIDTRASAPNRRLGNVPELRNLLARVNCTTRVVHNLHLQSTHKQGELFASADVLVVPHGGSSMNAVLMRKATSVLEIAASCTRWSWIFDFGYVKAKSMSYEYMPAMQCAENTCNYDRHQRLSRKPGSRGNIECPELTLDIPLVVDAIERLLSGNSPSSPIPQPGA